MKHGTKILRKLMLGLAASLLTAVFTFATIAALQQPVYSASMTYAAKSNGQPASAKVSGDITKLLESGVLLENLRTSSPALHDFDGTIHATQVGLTNLIEVCIQWNSVENTLLAMEALQEQLPEATAYLSNSTALQVIQEPKASSEPIDGLNLPVVYLFSALVGITVMCLVLGRRDKRNVPTEIPDPIDLYDCFKRMLPKLRRWWGMIPALGLAMALVFFLFGQWKYEPEFEAKALVSVRAGDISADYYDDPATQMLAFSFPAILSTDLFEDILCEKLGSDYVNGVISAYTPTDTNLFVLSVRSNFPQDAYDTLLAAVDEFSQVAVHVVKNPQLVLLEDPVIPQVPTNPFDGAKLAILGGFAGIAIGFAIIFAAVQIKSRRNTPPRPMQ